MLAGMARDLSPRVAHKSCQESGWTKGVTSGAGTGCTELPSKTQSAYGQSREDSWGHQLGTGQPALRACPILPLLSRMGRGAGPRAPPTPAPSLGVPSGRRAPSRAPAALTGCGLRSEGRQDPAGWGLQGWRVSTAAALSPEIEIGTSCGRAPPPERPPPAPPMPGLLLPPPCRLPVFVWGWSFSRSESGGESSGNQGRWAVAPGSLRGAGMDGWTDGWIDVGRPASTHLGVRQGSLAPPTPGRPLVGRETGRVLGEVGRGGGGLPRDSKNQPFLSQRSSLPSCPPPRAPPTRTTPSLP